TIQTNKRRIAVMVAPHLSGLLVLQSDFGPRPVLSCRHDVSDFSPKSGLWRGSQHQTAVGCPASPLRRGLIEEKDDAKGHRQMVQSDQGLRVHKAIKW